MRTLATILAASAATFCSAAYAADAVFAEQPVYAEPAPERFSWTGFYVGVHAGYGSGSTSVRTTLRDAAGDPAVAPAENDFDSDGWLGGVQAGFNYQIDQFVLGVEGEYSATNIDGEFNFDPLRPEAVAGGSIDGIAAIKGRVGIAFDRTLIFATAGYAAGWNEGFANNVFDVAPAEDVATGDDVLHGYVVGVGVEHALTQNLSIKGEYNYYDFSRGDFNMTSDAYPDGFVLQAEPEVSLNVFKVGLNYRF